MKSLEIAANELKDYVTSSRASKLDEGYLLEPKFGAVSFDFSNVGKIEKCLLVAKRISGNGKLLIAEQREIIVASKISQQFEVQLNNNILQLSRNSDSIGEVKILGVTLELDDGLKLKEEILSVNWKRIIASVGNNYKNIKLVNGRLFASENAHIKDPNDLISEIETEPKHLFIKESYKIKFLGSCEITKIILNDNPIPKPKPQLYPNRTKPTPQTIPDYNVNNSTLPTNVLVYDSQNVKEFNRIKLPNTKTAKYILSNGQDYLLLKKEGNINIPISALKANTEYTVIVTVKKMNGNGKFNANFITDKNTNFNTIVADHNFSDKVIKLITPNSVYPGETIKLNLNMTGDCAGEILISKIAIYSQFFGFSQAVTRFTPLRKTALNDRKFVIVIPSYKNSKWCDKNIISALNQDYDKYRIIFTDDCSPDDTFEKVSNIVNASPKQDKVKLIKNFKRLGAFENLYNMITSCDDDEIILTLDGDDWLAHPDVLSKLNEVYRKEDVWMTYGQYKNHPDGQTGISEQIPGSVIDSNSFRSYRWCASHLRTFYAWLFKRIELEDLKYKGEFMKSAWDLTMIIPMLEMSGKRSRFISDILYIYNLENPINDHKVDRKLQADMDRYNRSKPRYQRLNRAPLALNKDLHVGLLVIATGKYDQFLPGLISSADNYFLNQENIKVTYYILSDKENNLSANREIVQLNIPHRPFPYATMDRYKHFTSYADRLQADYLYYVDVDCLFVDHVSDQILGDLVGVQHCGFFNKLGPFENNPKSNFYIPEPAGLIYFGGGFQGGKRDNYLSAAKKCYELIEDDLSKDHKPLWEDESAWNYYLHKIERPDVVLTPEYHYPQTRIEHYKSIWKPYDFRPKILLLEKNHAKVR